MKRLDRDPAVADMFAMPSLVPLSIRRLAACVAPLAGLIGCSATPAPTPVPAPAAAPAAPTPAPAPRALADPAHPALTATLTGARGHVFSVAFSPSGQVLAAASNDGTVHLWDTSPAVARAAVCAAAGQPLTRQEWATYVPGLAYRAPC